MKKLLSIALVLVLILSLGATAFADNQDGNEPSENYSTMPANQQNTVNIHKIYKLTNEDTISPAEKVEFTSETAGVTDAADGITDDNMPGLISVELEEYAEGIATTDGYESNLVVTLPAYTGVGVYSYTITETDGNKAGVTYGANSSPITLVVTVIQGESQDEGEDDPLLEIAAIHAEGSGEDKSDEFTNEYSAGSLSIAKTVTGNMGDQTKYFDITVTLTAPEGDTVGADITLDGGSHESNPTVISKNWTGEKTVTLKLKHGDTITLENIPYGVTYTVTEADYTDEGYDEATGEITEATEIDSAESSVEITNNKDVEVDTGISLDSLPYILIVVLVVAALAVMVIRKRRSEV